VTYLARYNKAWQHKKTKKMHGNKLTLIKGEKLGDYTQVDVPKTREKLEGAAPKENNDIDKTDQGGGKK